MNMLAFDPIRAVHHNFLRVSPYFAIPPKLYKRSEAIVRQVRVREVRERRENKKPNRRRATSEFNKTNHKLEEEVLSRKLLQLSNMYNIDVCITVMVLKQEINKGL